MVHDIVEITAWLVFVVPLAACSFSKYYFPIAWDTKFRSRGICFDIFLFFFNIALIYLQVQFFTVEHDQNATEEQQVEKIITHLGSCFAFSGTLVVLSYFEATSRFFRSSFDFLLFMLKVIVLYLLAMGLLILLIQIWPLFLAIVIFYIVVVILFLFGAAFEFGRESVREDGSHGIERSQARPISTHSTQPTPQFRSGEGSEITPLLPVPVTQSQKGKSQNGYGTTYNGE